MVIVQGLLDPDREAIAHSVLGLGLIVGLLALSPKFRALPDRAVMLTGAGFPLLGLLVGIAVGNLPGPLLIWFLIGLSHAPALTPAT